MKRVTATEARKNWFRYLDEAAEGEVLLIERGGTRLVLHREAREEEAPRHVPSYEGLIWAPHAEDADRWGWEWKEPGEALSPVDRDR
ncbi:MAG TPA: hypothetical protein VEL74_10865 [Thermoanaerobaculia bacterium]|nr:hypothetical protein [Thermoanaerobaculia bacterium]